MLSCHECDSEVAEQDIFCPYCGISLQQAEAPNSGEINNDAGLAEDEMDSTLMMTPAEAKQLANEVIAAASDLPPVDNEAGNSPSTEPAVAFEPEPIGHSAVSEPLFSEIQSLPARDDITKTSDNIESRKTAEYAAVESVEFTFDDIPVSEELKELPRIPESTPFVNDAADDVNETSTEKNPSAEMLGDSEGFGIPGEIVDLRNDPSFISGSSEGKALAESETSESINTSMPANDSEQVITAEKPVEEMMISMPDESLELNDPFVSQSMFDSVRIIEGQIPFAQEDIATRVAGASVGVDSPKTSSAGLVDERPQETLGNTGSDTDGRKSSKLKPLSEGTILNGRYEIVRKIGGGGMGAVYLASDANLGGVLRAVKEMVQSHIEDDQQEKAIADFKRESMILSTLDHPSIPTIFDYFYDEEEGRFYLVMKYISGGDLSTRLRSAPEGKVDETIVVDWAIQITEVLEYLHNQPSTIVYRDLKPSNIMIDGNSGKVMLIDFGIARSISQKEEKGVTAVGTMGYAPPELFSGNVEPRSDIYSLGSTMFHLLTGADPQSNPLLIFDFQKNPRPRQINPRLSDQIERILMKSVEYNADSRYKTAGEFRSVLREHFEMLKKGDVTFGATVVPAPVSLASQQVFCGFCGQKIVATDMFCAFCGAKQPMAQQGVHAEIYSSAPKTARLLVEGTTELNTPSYILQKDENLVGRRDPMSNIFPEVDLSKYDPQTKISRRHARIWRDGHVFHVEDLGSSNGTLLTSATNESFRLPPHKPYGLSNGDKIKIGDTILHFLVN